MYKASLVFALVVALFGYSHLASASSDGFLIEVDGMPRIEGSSVVSLGFGSNMKYSFATSEASVSVAMPGERLTIRYLNSGHTCQNFGDTHIEFGESRAEISGQVGCRAKEAQMGDREDVPINGWFDLDK